MSTPSRAERDEGAAGKKLRAERIALAIIQSMLRELGKPADLCRVAVIKLWDNHHRVNVQTGSNAVSACIAQLFPHGQRRQASAGFDPRDHSVVLTSLLRLGRRPGVDRPLDRLLPLRAELAAVALPRRPNVPRLGEDESGTSDRAIGRELSEPVKVVWVAAEGTPPARSHRTGFERHLPDHESRVAVCPGGVLLKKHVDRCTEPDIDDEEVHGGLGEVRRASARCGFMITELAPRTTPITDIPRRSFEQGTSRRRFNRREP